MKHIHLIGIGGSGLSAIARVLLEKGYTVSGSDRLASPLASALEEAGAKVFIGHQAENITGADVVVRSSAVPDDNPEVKAARKVGIPVMKRVEFLAQLFENERYTTIAVAGTHGKTTTTAMIAWELTHLGRDPSFIIGGISKNLGTNAHAGKGADFVIEADEYDHMFMGIAPDYIVVTNVDYDHPDCYPTRADYTQAFADFTAKLKPGGALLVCAQDPGALELGEIAREHGIQVLNYGLEKVSGFETDYKSVYSPDVDMSYLASGLNRNQSGCMDYQVWFKKEKSEPVLLSVVKLQVPGVHNVLNSLAAVAIAHRLGLPVAETAESLHTYSGTGRRFDLLAEAAGISIINDYAHHPTEIRTTLAAARSYYSGRRLWVIWQPHTITRTRTFFADFQSAFDAADQVVVTAIYGAREDIDSQEETDLLNNLVRSMTNPAAQILAASDEVVNYLKTHLLPGDVVLVLSAGDAEQISIQLAEVLRSQIHG